MMRVRSGDESDDSVLIQHYMALWDSYGTLSDHYSNDAAAIIRTFLQEGRSGLGLGTFIAEVDGVVAGSSACQLQVSPYPNVIKPDLRKFGYIWHVFVFSEFGRRGIGRALTQAAIDHLKQLGCTTVVLNASEAGEPLYTSMGFQKAKEMRLMLSV
jgi:ribosomal protein S18 acetylase RimI-like enzyme